MRAVMVAAIVAVSSVLGRYRRGASDVGLAAAALTLASPALAVPSILVPYLIGWGRSRRRARIVSRRADRDVSLLAELVGLGIAAGLPLRGALGAAAAEVAAPLRREVDEVLRAGTRSGLATALEQADGRAGSLYRLAGRAAVTGAPLGSALKAFVAEQQAEERAATLASVRRLPVRLLFPLSLLILPGFMVLTVGPTLLGAIDRLGL